MSIDWEAARETYKRDGVVQLSQVLGADALQAALKAWEWSIAHPHAGGNVAQKNDGIFFQDLFNPGVLEGYRSMLEASPIPDICAKLWGTDDVWFMYEQVFLKEGGETRRTPWHQDASYLPVGGADTAVAWITFDPISKEDSLEFVRALTTTFSTTPRALNWVTTPRLSMSAQISPAPPLISDQKLLNRPTVSGPPFNPVQELGDAIDRIDILRCVPLVPSRSSGSHQLCLTVERR
jgi:hypothetical protein